MTEEPAGFDLAAVDDQIFATDPMAPAIENAPQGDALAIPAPAEAAKTAQKLAALTPPSLPKVTAPAAVTGDANASVAFMPNKQDLSDAEKEKLSKLADDIKGDNSSVRIVAYAGGSPDQASMARRVSLARALSVRAFLIDKGVDQLRFNVQAKGNKNDGGSPDRADIFVQ